MVTRGRGTTKTTGGYIYFPLSEVFYPKWIIKVFADDGTTYYVSDLVTGLITRNYLLNASITRPVTDALGSFRIKFANPDGLFTGKFNGGEVVEVYADYGTATTLQFRGKIDNPHLGIDSSGFYVEIDGRDYPELGDRGVILKVVGSKADVALCDLFNKYFANLKLQFWNGTSWITATFNPITRAITYSGSSTTFPTTGLTVAYQNKKGWQTVSDICRRVGLECYLYYDTGGSQWYLRTFIKDSIKNDGISVTYGGNLISCSQYGYDNTQVYNRITVFGKQESSNIVLMATEENAASQANLWIKDKASDESSLTSMTEVRSKAVSNLLDGVSVIVTGKMKIVGSDIIKPGDQIAIGIPLMGVSGYHTIGSLTLNFSNSGFTTDLEITRKIIRLAQLFKEKLDVETESKPYINLNDMKDSYTVYFNESPSQVITHADTEEVDDKLQLQATKTLGVATLRTYATDYNITSCEFRKYSNFPVDSTDTYEVSNDGGVTWEDYDISTGEVHTFSSVGSSLTMRLTLRRVSSSNETPSYESICILYR